MKNCKVYCTYFGERRGVLSLSPANADETLEVFKKNIQNDLIIDCGVNEMDIIVVNNKSDMITKECEEYLESIDNMKTPYGIIKVINRENTGGSLGAYSHAFDLYGKIYDYWLFIEDDLRMIYSQYYKYFIEEFNDQNLGFLSLTKINNQNDINKAHVSGGFGVSKKEILEKIKSKYGKLPYEVGGRNYGCFGNSETLFTNCFLHIGYDIRIPNNEELLPLADNWEGFPPHVVWQNEKKFNLENNFLYHIGL